MYFITPSKPGIFLIGIHGNKLYGFGEKNKKLCIYHKSIFDSGDWEEFFIIDVNVVKAECCENGLHVAAGIFMDAIFIAVRDKEFTRVLSIDICTKELDTYKMFDHPLDGVPLYNLNLCCNCLMPIIRYIKHEREIIHFMITPRQFKKDEEICQYILLIVDLRFYGIAKMGNVKIDHDPSSSIAFSIDNEALSVNERSKEDGRIKKLSINVGNNRRHIVDIPDNNIAFVWHDITFLSHNFELYFALTQRKNDDNVTLRLYFLKFPDFVTYNTISFQFIESYTVDVNFPAFESSPFLLSNLDKMIKPDFIVFESSVGIVTVPLRMLSLSESAYLALRQIPEPPVKAAEIKPSIFQRIRNLFRRKPKKVKYPWMSLNFIKKSMGLSNNFELR